MWLICNFEFFFVDFFTLFWASSFWFLNDFNIGSIVRCQDIRWNGLISERFNLLCVIITAEKWVKIGHIWNISIMTKWNWSMFKYLMVFMLLPVFLYFSASYWHPTPCYWLLIPNHNSSNSQIYTNFRW